MPQGAHPRRCFHLFWRYGAVAEKNPERFSTELVILPLAVNQGIKVESITLCRSSGDIFSGETLKS
jgi:hypothetical protein